MSILFSVVVVLFCIVCLLFLVVHPFACIFQCAFTKEISGGRKVLWILLSFFFGMFASVPYAFAVSGSPRLRSLTLQGMMFGAVCLLLGIGLFFANPELRNAISIPVDDTSALFMEDLGSELTDSIEAQSQLQDETVLPSNQIESGRLVSVVEPQVAAENFVEPLRFVESAAQLIESRTESNAELDQPVSAILQEANDANDLLSNEPIETKVVDVEEAVTTSDAALTPDTIIATSPVIDAPAKHDVGAPVTEPIAETLTVAIGEESPVTGTPAESQKESAFPSQLDHRNTQIKVPATTVKPANKKPINRYRSQGSEIRGSVPPKATVVRNLYRNQ